MLFWFLLESLDEDERDLILDLYDKYKRKSYIISFSILHNETDAENAVQDTFIKIMNDIEKFMHYDCNEIKRKIVIYTRSVAINIYNRNSMRKKIFTSNTFIDENGDENEIEFDDDNVNVENFVINNETTAFVENILKELKPIDKQIIKLTYYLGYKSNEVAEVLGISDENVRVRLNRVKSKIKKQYGGDLHNRYKF